MTDTLTKLADERDIRRLIHDYARGADTRDGELFASVFVEHAVLELSGRETVGRHRLARIPGMLEQYVKTYHMVHNVTIDLDGDTATGEVYSASHHLRPIEKDQLSDRVMYITYRDAYVRAAEGWRIARRLVDVQFIEYKIVSQPD
ncbi:MAG: nuclear transport factor 2 family protein [Novosphingobium sp.]|nr:nuclear transport factor 2 family protein [Novosphingobium sp.]